MSIKKEKCNEYTIMIVPRKCGTTKSITITTKRIKGVFTTFCVIIIASITFTVHSMNYKTKYSTLNDQLAQVKLEKAEIEENVVSLEAINQYNKENIDKLHSETKNVQEKLVALNEIEYKINGLLNNDDMQNRLSRGGITQQGYSSLITDIDNQISSLNSLSKKLEDEIAESRKIPSILPCQGMITSYYGYRKNPFGKYTNEFHAGVDIANSYGTSIYATADGVIEFAGWNGGYGKLVIINHGNGYKSYYGHNSKLIVSEGIKVEKGDIIAKMGSTGRSTGNHTHFEIRLHNETINPLNLIKGGN